MLSMILAILIMKLSEKPIGACWLDVVSCSSRRQLSEMIWLDTNLVMKILKCYLLLEELNSLQYCRELFKLFVIKIKFKLALHASFLMLLFFFKYG